MEDCYEVANFTSENYVHINHDKGKLTCIDKRVKINCFSNSLAIGSGGIWW